MITAKPVAPPTAAAAMPLPEGALAAASAPAAAVKPRLDSIDLLRGLIMVVMALDHTRAFFSNARFYPLDLDQTYPALFITRWITHYCAPLFVFLAGTAAFLSTTRGRQPKDLSWFLLSRGAWLILLEITVIRWFGWRFDFDLRSIGVGVIWAIGWSMIALAGLVRLPPRVLAGVGLLIVFGHNALDPIKPEHWGSWAWLWRILHEGGGFSYAPGYSFGSGYPLLPWIGVMATGFAFGRIVLLEPASRRRVLLSAGLILTFLFIVLRASNLYGDPTPWSAQKSGLFSAFSFVHCQKYPPSLLFLLMTIGPALVALSCLDRGTPRWLEPVLVFGRVPLFYYLLHLPLIHLLAVIFNLARYGRANWLYGTRHPGDPPVPPDVGYDLPIVYAVWILVVLLLYPLCRWFAAVKRRNRSPWLSYL